MSGVVAISAGSAHTCALTAAGGVKCWGSAGLLGDGRPIPSDGGIFSGPVDVTGLTSGVASISASPIHTCAVTQAGRVKCWGFGFYAMDGTQNQIYSAVPTDVAGLTTGVVAVSAGESHDCALTQAGRIKCWGRNVGGKLGDGIVNSAVPVDVADF